MADGDSLEKRLELAALMSAYAQLLTERQRETLRMYYEEDLSLSEIAEQTGVSRQGVHDALTRAARDMRGYEEKLGLLRRDREARGAIKALFRAADALPGGAQAQAVRDALSALTAALEIDGLDADTEP